MIALLLFINILGLSTCIYGILVHNYDLPKVAKFLLLGHVIMASTLVLKVLLS